jgi:hypothetical protein
MRIQRRNFLHLAMGAGGSLILPQFAPTKANAFNLEAPVPPILSANDLPPKYSAPIVLKTNKTKRMLMFADSDNSSKQCYVTDIPDVCSTFPNGTLRAYWDGKPAADYTMTLRQFWRFVGDSFTRVFPGNSETKKFTHSWGISKTVSDSMTASLGLQGGGLSASVSETFSDSVTTDDNKSEEASRTIGPPADGMVRVWMIWQLVHEIVALDPAGKVVAVGKPGDLDLRKADVDWPALALFGPKCGSDRSGAWVYYKESRWLFPSRILSPSQRDFPAS